MQTVLSMAVSVLQILYRKLQNSQLQTLIGFTAIMKVIWFIVYKNVVLTRICKPKRWEVRRGNEKCFLIWSWVGG
jgi:hypothetical protein